jgi:hypothetical protein
MPALISVFLCPEKSEQTKSVQKPKINIQLTKLKCHEKKQTLFSFHYRPCTVQRSHICRQLAIQQYHIEMGKEHYTLCT